MFATRSEASKANGLQVAKVTQKRPYAFGCVRVSTDDHNEGLHPRPIGAILIAFPGADDRREIDLTLKLDTQASELLWKQVSRLVDDIERHIAMQTEIAQGRNRAEQLQYIRTLSRYLTKLENHLTNRDLNTDRFLRSHLGPRLGELLSHQGFERLIESSPGYSVDSRFPPERVDIRDGRYRALEDEMLQRRVNLAQTAAPRLLLELVRDLNGPLLRFLEIERQNKGGAPGNLYRNHLIEQLAPIYQRLRGEAPTSTSGGGFVTMCEVVLAATNLETGGVEQAAARILRRLKMP